VRERERERKREVEELIKKIVRKKSKIKRIWLWRLTKKAPSKYETEKK